jgi:hypothetical protein
MDKCILSHNQVTGKSAFAEVTQEEWVGKWNDKTMYYEFGECSSLSSKELTLGFNMAFTTWELEIDLKLHPATTAHPANFRIRFSKTDQMFIDKPSVLAYAYFPAQGSNSGIVVFNDNYIWSLDGMGITVKEARERGYPVKGTPADDLILRTYNIINVGEHELGHSLGLRHDVTGNGDGADVMDAYYGNDRKNLSPRDIERILLKYPARVYSRFTHYARLKKWLARKKASF